MKLLIKPLNDIAKKYYLNHNHYHKGDAGLDLYVLEDQTFKGFMSWLLHLRKELLIPHTLKELIQEDSKFEEMSKMAKDDPSTEGNPIPLEINDFYNLYKDSYSGIL